MSSWKLLVAQGDSVVSENCAAGGRDIRRYHTAHGRWTRPSADGIELFTPRQGPITRYRYEARRDPQPPSPGQPRLTADAVESPLRENMHDELYVPRTVMLNADLPGAISLAAQGLTDQMFHIITALRGTPGVRRVRGICPAWLRVGRFVGLLVP